MTRIAHILGVLSLLALAACSEKPAPRAEAVDCRNDGRGCTAPFECSQIDQQKWECLPGEAPADPVAPANPVAPAAPVEEKAPGSIAWKQVSREQIPAGMTLDVKPSHAYEWTDRNGKNLLLAGVVLPNCAPSASPEDIIHSRIRFAHWVRGDDQEQPLLKRQVNDKYSCDCLADLMSEFKRGTFQLTDLDQDGYAEVTFGYSMNCTTDVSPGTFKLLLLEDTDKYILRGMQRLRERGSEGEIIASGEFTPGKSFASAPPGFLEHASAVWDKTCDMF